MKRAIRYVAHLYRWLLQLYPQRFRADFRDEMVVVFVARLEDASGRGIPAFLGTILHECHGLMLGLLYEHLVASRERLQTMNRTLRTIMTWAIAWTVARLVLITLLGLVIGGVDLRFFSNVAVAATIGWSVSGCVGGIIFAALLTTFHHHQAFSEIKPVHLAFWGSLAGFLLSLGRIGYLITVDGSLAAGGIAMIIIDHCVIGAAIASAMLVVARIRHQLPV